MQRTKHNTPKQQTKPHTRTSDLSAIHHTKHNTPKTTSHEELLEHFHPQDLPSDFAHVAQKMLAAAAAGSDGAGNSGGGGGGGSAGIE